MSTDQICIKGAGTSQPGKQYRTAGIVFTGMVAAYLLFVLPYSFPLQVRIVSPSYAFGFNNKVGILSFVCFVLMLSAAQAWLQRSARRAPAYIPIDEIRPFPRSLIVLFSGFCMWYVALTAIFYLVVAKSSGYYKIDFEASHFLWRLKLMAAYGLRPYRDFVSEHGPAFVYGPAWVYSALRPFAVTTEGAYYIFDCVLNLCGLAVLAHIVNSLAMSTRSKLIAFSLIAIPAFSPTMGLNGLLIRTLFPFWSLLLIHRAVSATHSSRMWLAALVALVTFVNVCISPEIGVAWIVALSCYGVLLLQVEMIAGVYILAASRGRRFALGSCHSPAVFLRILERFAGCE